MNLDGRSLELFFIDGRADGMLTAEVFNWTGHVLRVPRTQLKQGLSRKEAGYTGVYILFGQPDGERLIYVGEAEDMAERLRQHANQKDWWDSAVMITSAANNLHKAHVKYLEARLIEIANDVKASPLENSNQPSGSSLTEAATSNMESFLETLLMVLPAIRVDNFLSKKRSNQGPKFETESSTAPPLFECTVPRHKVHATAVLIDGEMVMQKGSKVRPKWQGDRQHKTYYWKMHDEMVENGTIKSGVLQTDFAFTSPSAAAAVAAGRSSNGRKAWTLVKTGQTYGDWEEAQLKELTS